MMQTFRSSILLQFTDCFQKTVMATKRHGDKDTEVRARGTQSEGKQADKRKWHRNK